MSDYVLVCADAEDALRCIGSESVDLIVSSPPYNLGMQYDGNEDSLDSQVYLDWHKGILKECHRVLKNGGRLAWQTGATRNGKNYFPLNSWVAMTCLELGFVQRCEIIWSKKQIPSRTAWGSWCSPANNNVLPSYEYIELFSKGDKSLKHGGETDIKREEFIEWTNGLWTISPEMDSDHPAPFPVEIPLRLIKMNTFIGDTVLDPFMGSGSTGVACMMTGREFIGIEKGQKYIDEMAIPRIGHAKKEFGGMKVEDVF